MMINDSNIIKLIIEHSSPKLVLRELSKRYRNYIDENYKFRIKTYPLFDNIFDRYRVDKISIDTTTLETPSYFNNLVKYLKKHDIITIYILTTRVELLKLLFDKIAQYCKVNLIFPVGFNEDINLLSQTTNINGIILLERNYDKKIYKLPPNLVFFYSLYYSPQDVLSSTAIPSNLKLLCEYNREVLQRMIRAQIRCVGTRLLNEIYKENSNSGYNKLIKSGHSINIYTSDNANEIKFLTDDEFNMDIIYILNDIVKKYS